MAAVYTHEGHCQACGQDTVFSSDYTWYRDHLKCGNCRSIPRERAFVWCLETFAPNWRELDLHESSPGNATASGRMRKECAKYISSQFLPGKELGKVHGTILNENLEMLTFADNSLDLHCHLDVMEHVNEPEACFREMYRTLRPGGKMIFTTPVYEGKLKTERRARYTDDGVEHIAEPEYHGNPVSDLGALVTFHYGSDFADLILEWVPNVSINQVTLNDSRLGIIGKFREVFVITKY